MAVSVRKTPRQGKGGSQPKPDILREREMKPVKAWNKRKKMIDPTNGVRRLLPSDPPDWASLDQAGLDEYRRIQSSQLRWAQGNGTKAFLFEDDITAVINVCRLFSRWHELDRKAEHMKANEMEFDLRLIQSTIKALLEYKKAHEQLGYIPNSYNHIDLKEADEQDEFLFGE